MASSPVTFRLPSESPPNAQGTSQSQGGPSPAPPTDKERSNIELLDGMMGGGIDNMHALRLLRSFNGDVEKTASALLEGDTGGPSDGPIRLVPDIEPGDIGPSRPRSPPREPRCGSQMLRPFAKIDLLCSFPSRAR